MWWGPAPPSQTGWLWLGSRAAGGLTGEVGLVAGGWSGPQLEVLPSVPAAAEWTPAEGGVSSEHVAPPVKHPLHQRGAC